MGGDGDDGDDDDDNDDVIVGFDENVIVRIVASSCRMIGLGLSTVHVAGGEGDRVMFRIAR